MGQQYSTCGILQLSVTRRRQCNQRRKLPKPRQQGFGTYNLGAYARHFRRELALHPLGAPRTADDRCMESDRSVALGPSCGPGQITSHRGAALLGVAAPAARKFTLANLSPKKSAATDVGGAMGRAGSR